MQAAWVSLFVTRTADALSVLARELALSLHVGLSAASQKFEDALGVLLASRRLRPSSESVGDGIARATSANRTGAAKPGRKSPESPTTESRTLPVALTQLRVLGEAVQDSLAGTREHWAVCAWRDLGAPTVLCKP